jgi:hypothetical protein
VAPQEYIENALNLLEKAERPLVLVGKGMAWSRAEDDGMREFAEGRRDHRLTLFLERPHAAAIGRRGAADQDHRPAILLRIREAREPVHDIWAGHSDAAWPLPCATRRSGVIRASAR